MFQFPSNGKVYPKIRRVVAAGIGRTEFQFPSNGKVYPKRQNPIWKDRAGIVSIPFKREGISKVLPEHDIREILKVSIPFKREGISKETHHGESSPTLHTSFNSLQTGRYIQSIDDNRLTDPFSTEFQFPSNGKVYPKRVHKIPLPSTTRFNSLQTGRYIQRKKKVTHEEYCEAVSIPFKREGISKETHHGESSPTLHTSFNSLQTGRYIQSLSHYLRNSLIASRFNSLQTGRYIQRDARFAFCSFSSEFQFPSNGKVYPKRL